MSNKENVDFSYDSVSSSNFKELEINNEEKRAKVKRFKEVKKLSQI
jgi:hypothetical protein